MRRQLLRNSVLRAPFVPINGTKEFTNLIRLDDRGMMLDAWYRQRASQYVRRISIGAQCRKSVPKDAAREGTKALRRLEMPTFFDTLERFQQFVWSDFGYRALADVPIKQLQKPTGFLDRRGGPPFPFAFLDILLGDEVERRSRRDLRREFALPLFFDGIDTVDQLGMCFIPKPSRLLE